MPTLNTEGSYQCKLAHSAWFYALVGLPVKKSMPVGLFFKSNGISAISSLSAAVEVVLNWRCAQLSCLTHLSRFMVLEDINALCTLNRMTQGGSVCTFVHTWKPKHSHIIGLLLVQYLYLAVYKNWLSDFTEHLII